MKRVKELIQYACEDTLTYKLTGQNVGVAILDSGIVMHPDFGRRITAFKDTVGGRQMIYDDNGHGTHVAGIIGGSGHLSQGRYSGMAPGCSLISIKVLDNKGEGSIKNVIEGIKTVIAQKERLNIRIMNISVGTCPHDNRQEEELLHWVEHAWDAGLVVVAAAGNLGPEKGTITIPGVSKKVITVGATLDNSYLNISGRIRRNYSSRGPTKECVCKPDVVAPGSSVISCNASYLRKAQKNYLPKSGTSMSTPVVSGAIALLISKYPDITNAEVKLKLRDSCDDLKQPRNQQGWGQLNVKKLLRKCP